MPIRPSSAAEIRQLIDALGDADEVKREAAIARLAVIGRRAVEHLLQEYPGAISARSRAGMLRAFDAAREPRAIALVRPALQDQAPEVRTAAVALLRGFLTASQPDVARDALDALIAVVLDRARPAAQRISAYDALQDLPRSVVEPIRRTLTDDPDATVRGHVAASLSSESAVSASRAPSFWRDAGRSQPQPPDMLKRAIAALGAAAPLAELQRLVDAVRAEEVSETGAARREEWRMVRGAVHQALAARGSRLALYDLRDSLLEPGRLPVAFLAALEEIGDASCLEPLAAAYDASSRSGDAWWREHLAAAFHGIMQREGLTRRHAAIKRALARWPDAAADLIARR